MKCSNVNCPHGNYNEIATHPCEQCKEREREYYQWLDKTLNPDKEVSREQYQRHKGGWRNRHKRSPS